MLMPSKVKYRKQQRGRMRGKAYRGGTLAFGDTGLQVLEPGWITARQIEAGRIAMTRAVKRGETLAQQGEGELVEKEKQIREAFWKLRLQKATGQLDNPMRLKTLRRDLARVKTFRRALERKAENP